MCNAHLKTSWSTSTVSSRCEYQLLAFGFIGSKANDEEWKAENDLEHFPHFVDAVVPSHENYGSQTIELTNTVVIYTDID